VTLGGNTVTGPRSTKTCRAGDRVTHLMEGSVPLDVPKRSHVRDRFRRLNLLRRLDGSGERNFLYAQGNLTGIAYAEI